MSKSLPKVTLTFNLADDCYYVETIRGNVVRIQIQGRNGLKSVLVGSVLTEKDATSLGLVADLTVKRYTA